MSETVQIQLTKEQRDYVLQGLRFVTSNIRLEMKDPTPESVEERKTKLHQLTQLLDQVNSAG